MPLLVLLLLAALLLKLWGMVALFHRVGRVVTGRRTARTIAMHSAVVGLLLLGLLNSVPALASGSGRQHRWSGSARRCDRSSSATSLVRRRGRFLCLNRPSDLLGSAAEELRG
ncbi:MAG: hypothetical protein R2862_00365 [Thermoanaerobaculia bacterium]